MRSETTEIFSNRLKKLILNSNKSIKKLERETGVPSGSLSKYQNNEAEAGISSLVKLSKYFGASVDFLLGLSELPSTRDNEMSVKELGIPAEFIKHYTSLKDFQKHLAFELFRTNEFWSAVEAFSDSVAIAPLSSKMKITEDIFERLLYQIDTETNGTWSIVPNSRIASLRKFDAQQRFIDAMDKTLINVGATLEKEGEIYGEHSEI